MVAIALAALDERRTIGFVQIAVEDFGRFTFAARAVPLDIDGVTHQRAGTPPAGGVLLHRDDLDHHFLAARRAGR